MAETLFFIGDVIMLVALAGAVAFAVSYGGFFNWRKTAPGRALMYLVLTIFAWGTQSVLARLDPDYVGREFVRIVVYLGISITIWRLVVTLWRHWGHPITVQPRTPKPEEITPD